MAILGVLLGITMTVLGYLLLELRRIDHERTAEHVAVIAVIDEHESRIDRIEKRKALLAEAATSAPKPAGVQKMRRWDENAPYKEAN